MQTAHSTATTRSGIMDVQELTLGTAGPVEHPVVNQMARRIGSLRPSSTGEVFNRAEAMRAAGIDLISFAVGEPDFPTPPHICEAAKRAIDLGASRYTVVNGIVELRRAICDDSLRYRAVAHCPEEVVVCVGAKHALFNLALALLDGGDEVVIPVPGWVSYSEQVRLAGATPVTVECKERDGFALTAEALSRAVTSRTKAVLLCAPCNPTGAVFSDDDLRRLAEVMRRGEYWIVVDEIYRGLTYDRCVQRSLLEIAPDLRERIIIVDGVSKRYAMTGWRIGWLMAPEKVARACCAIQSQATTNPTTVSQYAALAALTGPQDSVETMRTAFEARRDTMVHYVNSISGVRCEVPKGAFYVFANVKDILGRRSKDNTLRDDVALARWLLDEAGVAVVPGAAFGAPGYLRFTYTLPLEKLTHGMSRVARAFRSLE